MVATVWLDWGISFGAGVLFGTAARSGAARGVGVCAVNKRPFLLGGAFLVGGILPISLALYVMRPAWMWMYWVDPSALPVAVPVLAFAMYAVCFVAGFAAGSALELWRRRAGLVAAWTVGGLLTAGEIASRVRLFHFGTLEEFRGGRAPLVVHAGHVAPELWLLAVGGAASFALLAVMLRAAVPRTPRQAAERAPVLANP